MLGVGVIEVENELDGKGGTYVTIRNQTKPNTPPDSFIGHATCNGVRQASCGIANTRYLHLFSIR